MANDRKRLSRSRVLDFVAYVVIALSLAGMAIFFADEGIDAKWFTLLFETIVVFSCVVGYQRHRWGSLQFWLLLLAIFGGHLVVGIYIIGRVEVFRAWWMGVAFVLETALVTAVTESLIPGSIRGRRGVREKR